MVAPQFGFCLPIFASPGVDLFRTPNLARLDAPVTMALGRLADELGFDSLWVADHLMLGQGDAILEGWTVLAALAGATRRAKLGMIHQSVFFRHPALAAKMAATLDQISGGRLIHFLDGGSRRREHVGYGLPWEDDPDRRIDALLEATDLMIALWTTVGPVTHEGERYSLQGAVCEPKPVQRPHPPIWFGEAAPRMLDACARLGQGWNTTPVSIAELRRRVSALGDACARIGRPVAEIEQSLETQMLIAPDRDAIRHRLQAMVDIAGSDHLMIGDDPAPVATDLARFLSGEVDELPQVLTDEWIVGTPDEVAERLRAYQAEGISHFLLWFMDAPAEDGMRLFAREVAPRFRS